MYIILFGLLILEYLFIVDSFGAEVLYFDCGRGFPHDEFGKGDINWNSVADIERGQGSCNKLRNCQHLLSSSYVCCSGYWLRSVTLSI